MKSTALLIALLLAAAPAAAMTAAPKKPEPPAGSSSPAVTTRAAKPTTRRPAPLPAAGMRMPKPAELPDYIQHNNQGARLLSDGKAAQAITEFQAALAIRQDYLPAKVNLGLAYLETKQPEAAAAQFQEVLKKNPKTVAAMDGLATAYASQGKYEAAIAQERKLLQISPGHATAHYNIACWQALQNKTADAFTSLEQAVKLGYRDVDWMNRDPELRSLRTDKARWNKLIQEASKPVSERGFEVIEAAPASTSPKEATPPAPAPATSK